MNLNLRSLISNRNSLEHPASSGYAENFIEDTSNRAFPFLTDSNADRLSISVVSNHKDAEELLVHALMFAKPQTGSRFQNRVFGLLRHTAKTVLGSEQDICATETEDRSRNIAGKIVKEPPVIRRFLPGSYRIDGQYLHTTEHKTEHSITFAGSPRKIPLSTLTRFKLPETLEGRIQQLLSELARIDNHTALLELGGYGQSGAEPTFDADAYRRTQLLALVEATDDIGWHARCAIDPVVTEYYLVWRELSYESFVIELRNHLIKTLNQMLEDASKDWGFTAHVNIDGFPTQEDVEIARRDLKSGGYTLREIWERF